MYYLEEPKKEMVDDVSEAIKTKIVPMYKKDWINFFVENNLEIYFIKDFKFDYVSDDSVNLFVETVLNNSDLKDMKYDAFNVLKNKYKKQIFLFRDNLSYMGYSIVLLNNGKIWKDSELFTSTELNNPPL
jgi:hypothetical protein